MRYLYSLFFLLFIFITSCRVDEFSPCEKAGGMEGLLCKEFRFEKNVSIGYLAYYYNSEKQLIRMDYKSPAGEIKKYDTYEYEDNKIAAEHSFDANGKLIREKKYTYDAQELLSSIYYIEGGVEVSSKSFEYANSLLQKESNFNHAQLDNYLVYQYYTGETTLYRKSLYASDNALLNYTDIEYFVNNYEKHSHYAGNHAFMGYELFIYNEAKDLTRLSQYDASEQLTSYIEYTYNTDGQLEESREYDQDGKQLKNTKYIYNN